MNDRVTIILQASVEFKEAVATFAQRNNVAASEIIRQAVAVYIGYDIKSDSINTGRPKKYATKEDRLEAQRNRQKQDRRATSQLLEDFARAQRRGDVKTLEEYIAMRVAMGKTTPIE